MFGDLNKSGEEQIKESGDKLGSGGLFDSSIYGMTIVAAYAGTAASGARSVTVEAKDKESGKTFKTTQWVTSGTEKGGKNYYEKDGEKHYLPGFELINAICMMTCNKGLAEVAIEQKTLKIWDSAAKAETPQQVPVLVDLTGKDIYFGVLKQKTNKQVKGDDGKYVNTNDVRELNELDRVFHFPSKKTMSEARAGGEAEFHTKWMEKWHDKVQDKYKAVEGGAAAGRAARPDSAGGTGESKPSSLFN